MTESNIKLEWITEFEAFIKAFKEKDMTKDKKFTARLLNNIRKNRDETSMILGLSSYLESCINSVVQARAANLQSPVLSEWSKNLNIPINQKIKILRFMNLISETSYEDLVNLFKVRNIIAHRNLTSTKRDDVFKFIDISKLAKNTRPKNQKDEYKIKMMLFVILIGRYSFNLEMMYNIISKLPPNSSLRSLKLLRDVGGR
jgi:hypothetical protein